MIALENYLHENFNLNKDEARFMTSVFKQETIKKGEYFLHSGAVGSRLSFIQEGILRIYVKLSDREVTQWISTRESFVTDFDSFFYQNPSQRDIQALADTILLTIDYAQYQSLQKKIPAWNEFERLFIGKCFIFMESRVFDLISLSAEERYKRLFQHNRELYNQVPLQYLASMLGMTPETFSRIRRKQSIWLKKKHTPCL